MRQLQVVKIGTNSVFSNGSIDYAVLFGLGYDVARLNYNGATDSVLVVSGAVRLGMREKDLTEKPQDSLALQSCARVGQPLLMKIYTECLRQGYEKFCHEAGINRKFLTSQYLITYHNLDNTFELRNMVAGIRYELDEGIVPLVNYNDGIDPTEVKRDNDNLAARIAKALIADRLVIMTDVDGLYEAFSDIKKRKLIKNVSEIGDLVRGLVEEKGKGTGSIKTKLGAAELMLREKIPTIIGNARYGLSRLIAEEQIRTIFIR